MDFSRFITWFTDNSAIPFDLILEQGQQKLDAALAEGDAKALAIPEFAPEWQIERAKLVAAWERALVVLFEARDNPEMGAKLGAAFNEALQTFIQRHGELGPSHGHSG